MPAVAGLACIPDPRFPGWVLLWLVYNTGMLTNAWSAAANGIVAYLVEVVTKAGFGDTLIVILIKEEAQGPSGNSWARSRIK